MNATTVHVTVDESGIEVPEGSTVLDAVNRLGIPLPQLCKDPDRAPLGACRTCLVHVEGQRGVPAACHLPARDGHGRQHRRTPRPCASARPSST